MFRKVVLCGLRPQGAIRRAAPAAIVTVAACLIDSAPAHALLAEPPASMSAAPADELAKYLEFRNQNGLVQDQWIDALTQTMEVVRLGSPVSSAPTSPALPDQVISHLNSRWLRDDPRLLGPWIATNRSSLDKLQSCPTPKGVLPLRTRPKTFYEVLPRPDLQTIRSHGYLLLAEVVLNSDSSAVHDNLRRYDSITKLVAAGYSGVEIAAALSFERAKLALLLGAGPGTRVRQALSSRTESMCEVVTFGDIAVMIREFERRTILHEGTSVPNAWLGNARIKGVDAPTVSEHLLTLAKKVEKGCSVSDVLAWGRSLDQSREPTVVLTMDLDFVKPLIKLMLVNSDLYALFKCSYGERPMAIRQVPLRVLTLRRSLTDKGAIEAYDVEGHSWAIAVPRWNETKGESE